MNILKKKFIFNKAAIGLFVFVYMIKYINIKKGIYTLKSNVVKGVLV
ncbi:hypothetical protein SAMN02745912_02092 [Paramaledivibacter caminithermalis DSM 15212]|jgi:hypothetical protein|uniref:Uncharacterized protein n=1 Tax=Paramaledivibacter caminithermalis (strain DSM 15212 / CIP 107654 / DViRD3) TaxID=1121301 RepID=A0A1M6PC17_PARC5|nr:hypothetical protein SAMN02745912_02092 [Paramaledivibacter caminithermalis DSM 15212]